MNKTFKNIVIIFIKAGISFVLIYLLFSKISTDTVLNNVKSFKLVYFFGAVLIFTFSVFLAALRLQLFIPEKTGIKNLFRICYIGFFFNICLPGIVGGDVVKIYYINTYFKKNTDYFDKKLSNLDISKIKKSIIAVGSVFLDQYMSLFTILVIGTAIFPFSSVYIDNLSIRLFVPVLFGIFIFSSILILKFKIGKKFQFIAQVYDYLKFIAVKRDILLKAFIYSIVIQFFVILSVYILSKGLSLNISLFSLFTFIPIIIAISLVPISISGIGLRENAFVFLLGKIGISPEKALSLSILWFLSIVIGSLPGLIEYLRFKK